MAHFKTHSEWLRSQQDDAAAKLGYIPMEAASEEADRQWETFEQGSGPAVDAATLYTPQVRSANGEPTRYPWSLTLARRAMSAVGYTPSWSASDRSQSSYPWNLSLQDKGMEAIGYVRRDQAARHADGESAATPSASGQSPSR